MWIGSPYTAAMRIVVTGHRFLATVLVLAGGCVPPAAWAQDASPWDTESHAAARLVGGAARAASGTNRLRAGIEIRLDPGWKTYWRYPGDSGVPPTIDFAGSENIKSVTTLWPAPHRFADGANGYSVGYVDDVVLPLHIEPNDPAKPSALHVKLGYAVCGNVCVPAEANLDLPLPTHGGAAEAGLRAAEARVPRQVALGSGTEPGKLAVRSVRRKSDGTRERVVVEVTAPEGAPVDLYVEGPSPNWALPLPEPVGAISAREPGVRRFSFTLEGLPPGARADGATLTLTAVSPTDAIEVQAHLD